MAEDERSKGWLETLTGGGLPQIIAGPAGHALSRLIGAGIEIPAARLEQKAQSIRDETEASSKIMQILAEKSAALGAADSALLERGLNALLGNVYLEQKNREAVAQKTVEILTEDPPPADSAGPSDDWLNVFEPYAAKANSDEFRDIWSRILAGEIRRPQSFSLATLQFVSVLDKMRAEIIRGVLPFVVDGSWIPYQQLESTKISIGQVVALEEIGFGSRAAGTVGRTLAPQPHGNIICRMGKVGFIVTSGGNELIVPAFILSTAGRELSSVVHEEPSPDIFVDALKQFAHVSEIRQGSVADLQKGYAVTQPVVVYRKEGVSD